MLKVTETIVQFAVSEKSKENAWRDLVNDMKLVPSGSSMEDIKTYFSVGETEYMEQYHSTNPDAKTKKGRWKTSKYLPNAYKSAKSVITRAISNGVELTDTNGNPRGKSEVEKRIPKSIPVLDVNTEIKKHVEALAQLQRAGFVTEVQTSLHIHGVINIEE